MHFFDTWVADKLLIHLALLPVTIAVAWWSIRKLSRRADDREDIVVDGWIFRWADDPVSYAEEHQAQRRHNWHAVLNAILAIAYVLIIQLLIWIFA